MIAVIDTVRYRPLSALAFNDELVALKLADGEVVLGWRSIRFRSRPVSFWTWQGTKTGRPRLVEPVGWSRIEWERPAL